MLRKRYRRITFFFARVLAGVIFWDLFLSRIGLRALAERTRPKRMRKAAVGFRGLAVQMGGVMIKVGQFFSTRIDIFPDEIIKELAGLQDEVPPERFEDIKKLAETELGGALADVFAEFDVEPLAAASLGQVHRAVLHKSEPGLSKNSGFLDVVVKVQRPNIETIINTDMAALLTVGNWIKRYKPISKRGDVVGLLNEIGRALQEEIDYLSEGDNAETFAKLFQDDPKIRVPAVVWAYTTKRVLTLENVSGIKITDYEAITAAGVDRAEVAEKLFTTYLRQIFEDGFFHADPHPGNLFVDPNWDGDDWRLTFIDFGMVGQVPSRLREGLREMLIGVGTQDPKRVVGSYQKMGVLLPSADIRLLEKAEARAFEKFWGKSMGELQQVSFDEIEEFAQEFRELLYEMPFQVPQDLVWLGRTVAILSGMCTGLNVNFNVWEGVAPFAEKLITEEVAGGWRFWRDETIDFLRLTVTLPRRMDTVLAQMERGELEVQNPEQKRQLATLDRSLRRLVGAVVFAALLLGGVQLRVADDVWGNVFLGGAVLALGWVFWGR